MDTRYSVRLTAGLTGLLLPVLLLAHEPEVMQKQVGFRSFAQFASVFVCFV